MRRYAQTQMSKVVRLPARMSMIVPPRTSDGREAKVSILVIGRTVVFVKVPANKPVGVTVTDRVMLSRFRISTAAPGLRYTVPLIADAAGGATPRSNR